MSVISGFSEPERVQFGSSPSSIASFPIQSEYHPSVVNGAQSMITTVTANTMLPPDQANISFKPTTTAITKVNKLKLNVLLDSTIYTAGGILTGRLVVTSTTSRSLKLGEMSCELTAYEEVSTREYTASQSFLSSRLIFQGANLPPSNAVHGPKEDGYWAAKKGKTTFPFAFKIPIDAPSSVEYGNNACLKYIVTGVVQFMHNDKEDTIFKSKEAFVVEAWDSDNPLYKTPIDAINMKQLWMGGTGAVTLESTLIETLFQSGGNVSIKVRVKNDTKRRVQGLKVAITHRLLILANKSKKEIDEIKIVGETVAEEWFKNKDFLFDCGEDRTTIVHINVPKKVKTIRNTALFEVVCYVVVSLYLGPFMKDLTVHLPVYIAHSASIQPAPIADVDLNVFPNHYNMMDENADFFVEDIRRDDTDVLGLVASPMNIPSKSDRVLPWSDDNDDYHSPTKNSAGSYVFGSASPKKLGSLAQSFLGKPKQMAPTPSKLIAKSPPLAPASPYAYIPAIERVRYLSFTTQEQGAIQKRPYGAPPKSIISSSGHYTAAQQTVTPPPSEGVQKWLENQHENSPDSASVVLTEGEQALTSVSTSPWAHINRAQEIIGASPRSLSPVSHPVIPLDRQETSPVSIPDQDYRLPSNAFQRSNSLVSSPPGPSGLTLLMRAKSPLPSVMDHKFDDAASSISPSYDHIPRGRPLPTPIPKDDIAEDDFNNTLPINPLYEHIPRGRPLPTPIPMEDDVDEQYEIQEPKSDLLQVPRPEQSRSKTPPPISDTSTAIIGGNISALFKWGSSWIGYKHSESDNLDNQGVNQKDPVGNNNINVDASADEMKPRRALPAPPDVATKSIEISNTQNGEVPSLDNPQMSDQDVPNDIPIYRPHRSLPPIPDHSSTNDSAPKLDGSTNMPTNANSPPVPSKNVSATIEREVSIPPAMVEVRSDPVPIPASPPITKASIFAALGQKPLGLSPPSVPVALRKKVAPLVPVGKPSISPPKSNEFNVTRKPIPRKNPPQIEPSSDNNAKSDAKSDAKHVVVDNTTFITAAKQPIGNETPLVATPKPLISNNPSKPADNTPLITAAREVVYGNMPVLPSTKPLPEIATSLSSQPVIVNTEPSVNTFAPIPLPKVPTPLVSNVANINDSIDNDEQLISLPQNSPKMTSDPSIYINTTIVSGILSNGKLGNKIYKRKKVGLKDGKVDEENEGRLTAKIIEPPKQSLSPRLQEYISNYNKATGGNKMQD